MSSKMRKLDKVPGPIQSRVLESSRGTSTPTLDPTELEAQTPTNAITTLTPEEIKFLANAKASGQLGKLMAMAKDIDSGVSLEEIKCSSADQRGLIESVTKQATTLQSQVERYKSLVESGTTSQNRRAEVKHAQLARLRATKSRLEEMASSDEFELKRLIAQNTGHIGKLQDDPDYLKGRSRMLSAHSYKAEGPIFHPNDPIFENLLEKLQALGREINVTNKHKQLTKTARYYSSLEVMISVTALKRTLNSVFVEAIATHARNPPSGTGHTRAFKDETRATREEIESLWDEVVPVAHMAVEKTMLEPILQFVEITEKSHKHQNALIGSYIGSCLSFMNERLEVLAERMDVAIYHQLALLVIHEHYRAFRENDQTTSKHVPMKGQAVVTDNNTASMYLRKSMETFGSFSTKVFDPLTPLKEKIAILDEYVAERAAKDNTRLKNLHGYFESAMKTGLHEWTDVNINILSCLLADSLKVAACKGGALDDIQTEESIEALNEENRRLRVLQRALSVPAVGMDKGVPPFCHCPPKASTLHEHLDHCQHVTEFQNREDRAGFKNIAKQLEIIRRWNETFGATKE